MTAGGPRVSWALVDEVCQALERHGFHRAAGPLPDQVVTFVQALVSSYTAPPDQPEPYAAQPRPANPQREEPAPGSPGGQRPSRDVAGWGGEPASVRAAYDQRPTDGEPGLSGGGMEVDL